MEISDFNGKEIKENELIKKFHKIDKKFETNYEVFKDLRKKGYIVKTALKFGAEFRIYDKGNRIGESHSKWLCFPVSENEKIVSVTIIPQDDAEQDADQEVDIDIKNTDHQ